jgi:hypothetical protein
VSRSPVRSGVVRSAGVLAVVLVAGGCIYGFRGGGFPSDVKTVAVLPFDNRTAEPALTQEVFAAIQDAVSSRLGLRPVGETQADAVVRGEITRYEPDIPLSFQAGQGSAEVTRRRVQITINVEIFDQTQGKMLWRQSGLTVDGEYDTKGQTEADGRKVALAKLVTQVVEGAQSQW